MLDVVEKIIAWLNVPNDEEDSKFEQLEKIRTLVDDLSPTSVAPDDLVERVRLFLESHSGTDELPKEMPIVMHLLQKVAPNHSYLDCLLTEFSDSFRWDPDYENLSEIRKNADMILWAGDRGKQHLSRHLGGLLYQILELLSPGSDGPVRLVIVLFKMGRYARPAIPTLLYLYNWSLARRDDRLRDVVVEALIEIGPVSADEIASLSEQMFELEYRSGFGHRFSDYLDCNEMGSWLPDSIQLVVDNGWCRPDAVEHDDELKQLRQTLRLEFDRVLDVGQSYSEEFWLSLNHAYELGSRSRPLVPDLLDIAKNWNSSCETSWPVTLLWGIVGEAWDLELFLINVLKDPVTRIRLTAVSGLESQGWCELGIFRSLDTEFGGHFIKDQDSTLAGHVLVRYIEFKGKTDPFSQLHIGLMKKWVGKRQDPGRAK